ncbi:secreted protein [Moniliophthora roreri MCA 2997]|uniref:Secreted protein n=2 Tax=Moniliophthora roreri TaxID=221103 RepID=V2XN22_MONRO|nr:secreted protein [Moniliophthora roreri MCA 2997]KAI3607347.1 secreted protein [Moniliophthora roreri]
MHLIPAFALITAAAAVLAAPTTDVAGGAIKNFIINGSGCPPGSITTSFNADRSSVTATFSEFTPSVSTTSFRQNCQATIEISVPAGKKFTVDKVTYDGFVQLTPKVSVIHESTYYFQGQINQKTASDTVQGPKTSSVDLSNTFSGQTPIWSQCGATSVIVNIDISVWLKDMSNYADGFASVDSAKFGPFAFQNC